MKKTLSWWMLIGSALVAIAAAGAQVRSDIAADRADLQADRQVTVADNLALTDEQAKAFWPIYREYRGEMQKLGDRMVDLFLDYARNAESLSDAQAATLLDDYIAIQREEVKIKSAWVPKFRKVLPPKLVTRFYQIENKIDAILRYEAIDRIPLVVSEPKA
jgi:hypothetical protein